MATEMAGGLQAAVTDLLYAEAELLDDWRLDEWLDLFTDDAVYWIPARGGDVDPSTDTSHVYDDRSRLEERVWRLTHGPAYRQLPRSEMSHLVSNIRIVASPELIVVTSRVVVAEVRKDRQRIFAGKVTHTLRADNGDELKIAIKRVDLVDCTSPLANLTMIL